MKEEPSCLPIPNPIAVDYENYITYYWTGYEQILKRIAIFWKKKTKLNYIVNKRECIFIENYIDNIVRPMSYVRIFPKPI